MGTMWHDEDNLPEIKPLKEFVAVVNSQDITKLVDDNQECEWVTWGLRPFWPSRIITVVFWTGDPYKHWRSACLSDNPDTIFASCVDSEKKGFGRVCDSVMDIWRDLRRQIGDLDGERACAVLRIVNARMILEQLVDPGIDLCFMQPIHCLGVIESAIRKGSEGTYRSPKEEWKGEVQFLYMKEWMALNEWEDAFTREEMRPFLL